MGANLKELRKIVNFCRKSGIISFKTQDFDFTLAREALAFNPEKKPSKSLPEQPAMPTIPNAPLNGLDLLLWSSTPPGMEDHLE